jgi:hypothetical protein
MPCQKRSSRPAPRHPRLAHATGDAMTPRRWAVAAIILGIAAVAIALPLLRPGAPRFTVAAPAPGEARADYLADGTPIWVIGHADGDVSILSAFDTHVPAGVHKLTWWCPATRSMEEPRHGSTYDENGVKINGPAPAGLPGYDASRDGDRIVVGPAYAGPAPGTAPTGRVQNRGLCITGDPVIAHTFRGWPVWNSPAAALAGANGSDWFLVRGRLEPHGDGTVDFCPPADCDEPVSVAGVQLVATDPLAESLAETQTFLARARDGQIVDLTYIISSRMIGVP